MVVGYGIPIKKSVYLCLNVESGYLTRHGNLESVLSVDGNQAFK
jgi:hypothetical protein